MGSHPDRTGTAPQQLRHGFGVQPCDHAQHDHLGLKRRQGGYKRDRPLGGQVVRREICGIRRARHLPRLKVVQRGGRPPRPAPDLVDRAPARGGEQPGPPVRLVPRKPGSPRTTCSQVSAAMSSAASGAITCRYRSKAGLASRHSRVRAASLPDWAAVSTAASSSPTTGPSIGTLALLAADRPLWSATECDCSLRAARPDRGGDGAADQYLAGRPHRDDRAGRQVPVGYPYHARPQARPAQLPEHRAPTARKATCCHKMATSLPRGRNVGPFGIKLRRTAVTFGRSGAGQGLRAMAL